MSDCIKACTVSQLTLLREISIETYRDTFTESNSEALMESYLSSAFNIEKITAEFNHPDSCFYFIYSQDQVAGLLKVNEAGAQTDIKDDDSLEVERLYVRKAFFRKGLGNKLMAFACDLAIQADKSYLWLGVWEKNFRALSFYQNNDFVEIGKHPFDMAGDIQTDLVLKKEL